MLEDDLREQGYSPIKKMPNGELAGVFDYMFTASISLGITETGWRTRFCYANRKEAEAAFANWNGKGDPPGNWIKQKPEDRHGPGSTAKVRD